MIDYDKVNIYAAEVIFYSVYMLKLQAFLLSAAMGNLCEIKEDDLHGAFRCMKALYKQNIEQNGNLPDVQKEIEKQAVDRFYDEFDMRLTEELNRRCFVRIENR